MNLSHTVIHSTKALLGLSVDGRAMIAFDVSKNAGALDRLRIWITRYGALAKVSCVGASAR
jgi:hypothetical protein